MHDLLDRTCSESATLNHYAHTHAQTFLNSELFHSIINGSLHGYRPTLSKGIPDGPIDIALVAAGLHGLPATIARNIITSLARPYLGAGIQNIALHDFSCDQFVLGDVDTEYCFPFRVGGEVLELNVICSAEFEITLDDTIPSVEGLLLEPSSTLRGLFTFDLAPESSLKLLKLDIQRADPFTEHSQCDFHLLPRVEMRLGWLRWTHEEGLVVATDEGNTTVFDNDSVARPVFQTDTLAMLRAHPPISTSTILNSSAFAQLYYRVESARMFLQSLCACALGDVAGADHIYQMLDRIAQDSGGRIPVGSMQCPDVPALLCDSVVRPQLNGQVENIWSLVHNETRLSTDYLRLILLISIVLAAIVAATIVPRMMLVLEQLRDQLTSLDADDDVDSVLERFLRSAASIESLDKWLVKGSRAWSSASTPRELDDASKPQDEYGTNSDSLQKEGPLRSKSGFYEYTLLPMIGWSVNQTAQGATRLVAVIVWTLTLLGLTFVFFLCGIIGFVLTTKLLSISWCADHSIATAAPEGAVAGLSWLGFLYLLAFNPRMPPDVKHSLMLYLGALSAALGLRALTRSLASDGRWFTLVLFRYADLCEALSLLAVYYLSLAVHQQPASAIEQLKPSMNNMAAPSAESNATAIPRGNNWVLCQQHLEVKRAASTLANNLNAAGVLRNRDRSSVEHYTQVDAQGSGSSSKSGPPAASSNAHATDDLVNWLRRARQVGGNTRKLARGVLNRAKNIRKALLSRMGQCGRASVVPARLAAFWRRLGMEAAPQLTVLDLTLFVLSYLLLCFLNEWAITGLLTMLAVYSWILLLLECDMLMRTREDADAAWVQKLDDASTPRPVTANRSVDVFERAQPYYENEPTVQAIRALATTSERRSSVRYTLTGRPPPRTPAQTFEDALSETFSLAQQAAETTNEPSALVLGNAHIAPAARGGAVHMVRTMYLDNLLDRQAWLRDVQTHFVGGGNAIRAARSFWWSAVMSLCGVTLTALLEPMCNDLPCLQHASDCPLPYPLNHRSLGYIIDLCALFLLLIGAAAIRNVLGEAHTRALPGGQIDGPPIIVYGDTDGQPLPSQRERSAASFWARARLSPAGDSRWARCLSRTPLRRLLNAYEAIAAMQPDSQSTRGAQLSPPLGRRVRSSQLSQTSLH